MSYRAPRYLVVLFVALAAAFSGCARQRVAQVERPKQLQEAATFFLAGQYDQAVTLYTDFLGSNPSPALMAEGYVGRANVYFKLGKYDLSEADFQAAIPPAADRPMKAQATLGMANSVFAQERFERAEGIYRQILKSYVGLVPQDEVTYRLALAVARQGRWNESKQLLEQVIGSFPNGDYAKVARAKLAAVNDRYFTVQVGAFTNKAMADKAVAELKAKGLAAAALPIDIDGTPGFSVRSGQFTTWAAATEHADKLKAAGFQVYKLP